MVWSYKVQYFGFMIKVVKKMGGGQLIFSKRMGMSEKTSKLWENKEKSSVDTIHTAKNLAKFTRKKGADFVLILIYF